MTCNQFITTIFTGTGNRRNKDTVFTDALYGLLHTVIVSHTERVVWKWMELRQFDLLNHFQGFFLTHNTSLLTEYGVFVKVHNGSVRLCKKHIYLFSTPQCAYPFG